MQYDCLTLNKAHQNSKVDEKMATGFVFACPDMPQELVEDTIGLIVSDNTSHAGYKSIQLDFIWLEEKIKPINEELMSKLLNKSTDVNQLTIGNMWYCSPEFVSQLKNYAAAVF